MKNNVFNEYGFEESTKFEALMPKVMEILGEENLVGGSIKSVSPFCPTAKGVDEMEVISVEDLTK